MKLRDRSGLLRGGNEIPGANIASARVEYRVADSTTQRVATISRIP